jgi:hypothetical protein
MKIKKVMSIVGYEPVTGQMCPSGHAHHATGSETSCSTVLTLTTTLTKAAVTLFHFSFLLAISQCVL